MEFFDSHSHYNDEKFEFNRKELIQETFNARNTRFICAGYDIKSSKLALDIAKDYSFIYTTAGISPNDIEDVKEEDYETIYKLALDEKVVAIGEIGLDYYWNKENKKAQKGAFIRQIDIANSLNLPIVIHTRDAAIDTIDILKNKIHCKEARCFSLLSTKYRVNKRGIEIRLLHFVCRANNI